MIDFINALILGIVEGITEFLPISSTGHLIIMNRFIGFKGDFENMFDIVIQMGAILSVVIYFRDKLFPLPKKSPGENQQIFSLWKKTLVGVIPALVIGALAGGFIQALLFNPITVALALLTGGILLIYIEKRKYDVRIETIEQLSFKTAFLIGLIQCLAMIPGTSRSAATIIGAMLLGSSRLVAAEFSFFLAIPTLAAASAYSLLKHGTSMTLHEITVLAVGFIVSFLVAWIVIAAFMKYISKRNFIPFGYYRIILGIILIIFFRFL
jgi:undecaprenyl-diphosphatase